ncbi:MAG: MobF family relaxase [Cyanobacteria bacterium P01_D01_bin.156]
MLSIASVTAHHAAHYYSSDDIHAEAGPKSQWQGKAAQALELDGSVDADTFKGLLWGHTPDHRPLQKVFKIGHTPGIDLTFSAPKSISLATLWGGIQTLQQAHHQAIRAALHLIELSSGTRFWHGSTTHQHRFTQTGNLLIAQFFHTTSRAQDPQLHTHNVVLNTTHTGQDWRALDTRTLFKHRKLWQTVYHQDLAIHVQQLGYNVTRHQGHLELAGYTAEQLDYWSKRRQHILQAVGPHASRSQKQRACLQTRPKKQGGYSLANLRDRWDAENQRMGFGVNHPVPGVSKVPDVCDRIAAARDALEHLTGSLGLTDSVDTLTLIQTVFGDDGWGNLEHSFGYQDLAQAITEATEEGHLYSNNGQLSRSAKSAISTSQKLTEVQTTPYPYIDAVGQFTQAIAHNTQALLIAPVEHHRRLTQAVRQRLNQLGTLHSPHIARQQGANKTTDVTIYGGDRLWVPGRAGPVLVQVQATDTPGFVYLKHRNGKVTEWNLSTPRAFKFAWVQPPHRLPKHRIDEIHLVGEIRDDQLQKLSQKSRAPITVYRPEKERDVLTQPKHTAFTIPNLDLGPEKER